MEHSQHKGGMKRARRPENPSSPQDSSTRRRIGEFPSLCSCGEPRLHNTSWVASGSPPSNILGPGGEMLARRTKATRANHVVKMEF